MTPRECAIDALRTPSFESKAQAGQILEALEVMDLLSLGDDLGYAAELVVEALRAPEPETPGVNVLQVVQDVTGWTDKAIGDRIDAERTSVCAERHGRRGIRWTRERRRALRLAIKDQIRALEVLLPAVEQFCMD